jgi:ABC-type nickel/cobalt efflux system permease component RcnA
VLGAISGISIVWIGAMLLIKRIAASRNVRGAATFVSSPLLHDHGDGHVHSHLPDEVGMGGLVALGASGGLVPCPTALVLLLSAVSLGRITLGLTLLVAFSAGLAVVLTAVGLIVLYAKHLLPNRESTARNKAFRYLPIASAAVIICVGCMMTCVSLGWIRPGQLLPGLSG